MGCQGHYPLEAMFNTGMSVDLGVYSDADGHGGSMTQIAGYINPTDPHGKYTKERRSVASKATWARRTPEVKARMREQDEKRNRAYQHEGYQLLVIPYAKKSDVETSVPALRSFCYG